MRVLICDDHVLLSQAVAAALRHHGVQVVAVTEEPTAAVLAAVAHVPDICLLDVEFPSADGIEAAARILRVCPATRVVMLSAYLDDRTVQAALAAGARGFLGKTEELPAIVRALDRVMAGELVLPAVRLRSPGPGVRTLGDAAGEEELLRYLTAREQEVLRRLMHGATTDEIAAALSTARSTARTHIQNVLAKLHAHSRTEAVALALRHGVRSVPVQLGVGERRVSPPAGSRAASG